MAQATCEAQHTSRWKTTWIEEHVHPSYGHQNSIFSTLTLRASNPFVNTYV